MSILLRHLMKLRTFAFKNSYRSIYSSNKLCDSFDGEGKTTITVLNKNFDYGLMIDSVTERGFVLNNGIRTVGPMIAFSKMMLSWNIASSTDMNKESLSLLLQLEPKLEIVVIGLDDHYPHNAQFILDVKEMFRDHEIPLEMLPIFHACSTFNFLNAENRYAAAALIPPKAIFAADILLENSERDKLKKGESSPSPKVEIGTMDDSEVLTMETLGKTKEVKEYFKVRRPFKVDRNTQPPPDSNNETSKK